MDKRKVTLQDVAARTGYSINTVSRALKKPGIVSEKTRKLIQDTARQMGYVPNRAARSLRYGRSHTIAYIAGNILNPFFAMQYACIQQSAKQNGCTAMLFSANEDEVSELQAINAAMEFGVDGIILVPSQQSDVCLDVLQDSGMPFVLLSRSFPGHETDCVLCDEEEGGRLAARHLLEHGHRGFAYVCDRGFIHEINLRQTGFLREMATVGLDKQVYEIPPNNELDERRHARYVVQELLRLRQERGVTAIASFCDMTLRYIFAELHRTAPEQERTLAYIGFDNIDNILPSLLPLCSIGTDERAMCADAVELLLRRVNGESFAPQRIVYPVRLICRGSCQGGA